MQFVSNAREAWRWFSIQANALNTAFLATWALLPPRFQDAISVEYVVAIAIGLLLLGVFGRLVDQSKPAKPAEKTP